VGALDVNFVGHSWEWDALSDVLFCGYPCDGSFDSESESAVGDRAVFVEVEVPVVRFGVEALVFDSCEEAVVVVFSGGASDDFAEAVGCEQVRKMLQKLSHSH